jgi:hypothetical protein
MSRGALTVATYPFDTVLIRCMPCGREGRYQRASLMHRFGRDTAMPDVLCAITEGCPRNAPFATERCKAIYPDLTPR